MLLLLQAVRNAAGPVHVIVDSVPKSGEWPEWAKILTSTLAAGVAGLVGGFYLNRLKRHSDEKKDVKKMVQRIDVEFAKNYGVLLAAKQIMDEYDQLDEPTKKRALELMQGMLGRDTILMDYYRSNHVVAFYECRDCLTLAKMYSFGRTGVNSFPEKKQIMEMALLMAKKYAEAKGIAPKPADVWIKMLHGQMEEAGRLLME